MSFTHKMNPNAIWAFTITIVLGGFFCRISQCKYLEYLDKSKYCGATLVRGDAWTSFNSYCRISRKRFIPSKGPFHQVVEAHSDEVLFNWHASFLQMICQGFPFLRSPTVLSTGVSARQKSVKPPSLLTWGREVSGGCPPGCCRELGKSFVRFAAHKLTSGFQQETSKHCTTCCKSTTVFIRYAD